MSNINRILWRCKRGMLELDLMLARFAAGPRLSQLSSEELRVFADMLEEEDADLWGWLAGHDPHVPEQYKQIVSTIQRRAEPS